MRWSLQRSKATVAARGMPLYAGPKMTSNGGISDDKREEAMWVAYADARVSMRGPVFNCAA